MKIYLESYEYKLDVVADLLGATKEAYLRRDERTTDDPNKIPSMGEVEWKANGKNHRIENGRIVRDMPENVWVKDFSTIEELCAWVKRFGEMRIKINEEGNMEARIDR